MNNENNYQIVKATMTLSDDEEQVVELREICAHTELNEIDELRRISEELSLAEEESSFTTT